MARRLLRPRRCLNRMYCVCHFTLQERSECHQISAFTGSTIRNKLRAFVIQESRASVLSLASYDLAFSGPHASVECLNIFIRGSYSLCSASRIVFHKVFKGESSKLRLGELKSLLLNCGYKVSLTKSCPQKFVMVFLRASPKSLSFMCDQTCRRVFATVITSQPMPNRPFRFSSCLLCFISSTTASSSPSPLNIPSASCIVMTPAQLMSKASCLGLPF